MRFTSPLTNNLATAGLLGTSVLRKTNILPNGASETLDFLPAVTGVAYRIWAINVGWYLATEFSKTSFANVGLITPLATGISCSVIWPNAPASNTIAGLLTPSAAYVANVVHVGTTKGFLFTLIYSEVQTGG